MVETSGSLEQQKTVLKNIGHVYWYLDIFFLFFLMNVFSPPPKNWKVTVSKQGGQTETCLGEDTVLKLHL